MIVDSGCMSDDLPVEAVAAGHPVFACGPFDVYAVSPTYNPDRVL